MNILILNCQITVSNLASFFLKYNLKKIVKSSLNFNLIKEINKKKKKKIGIPCTF